MDSPIEEIQFLAGSAYRADVLRELIHEPCDRATLRDASGASKATMARLLNELEGRNWVDCDGHQYELTDPGRVIAETFLELVNTVETELSLRDVWQYLPTELPGFSISLFDDAVRAFTEVGAPYKPIPRTMELIKSARAMRMFSERIPKPDTLEGITRNAADGMDTELIFKPAVVQKILASVPAELIEQATESGCLTVLERDTFPTDATLVVYDDRVGLYCRDELGVTRLSIDTDTPEAVAWGASIYENVRSEARPVDLLERTA